jgi:hypothetical protein
MKVFISWSGERSRAVAESLHDWLPSVIQAVQPWMSVNDIEKGTRWRSGLANELEQVSVSLICLTPENLEAPWINFEAGALSKQQQNSYVCTFLFGLEPIDVREPLAQFQSTKAEKLDVRKLVHTINRVLADSALPETKVNEAFEVWWPKLETRLTGIEKSVGAAGQDKAGQTSQQAGPDYQRDVREVLAEILELVRDQSRESKSFLPPHLVLRLRDRVLDGGRESAKEATLAEIEANYIGEILAATKGNKTEAAQILGISRKSLYERIARRADLIERAMVEVKKETSEEDRPKDNLTHENTH